MKRRNILLTTVTPDDDVALDPASAPLGCDKLLVVGANNGSVRVWLHLAGDPPVVNQKEKEIVNKRNTSEIKCLYRLVILMYKNGKVYYTKR